MPELHTFTFMLQVYISQEDPDTEKRNQQEKSRKRTIAHIQSPTSNSNP